MSSLSVTLFKILLTVALLLAGGQLFLTGIRNRRPVSISAVEVAAMKPKAKWLEITHARLNLADACFMTSSGAASPSEVIIPIQPASSESYAFIPAFLHSRKKEYLDPTKKKTDSLGVTVNGVVETGISLSDTTVNAIKEHYGTKALGQFLVLEDGEQPSWLKGAGLLALGLVSLYWTLGGFGSGGEFEEQAGPTQQV